MRGFGIRSLPARLSLLAALALTACVTQITEDELERRLRLVGHSVLGPRARFTTVPVRADSAMMAWTLIASARAEGSSNEARSLHRQLLGAAERRASLVVGGLFPALTHQVVTDALRLNGSRTLPGLTLVVVGGEEPPPEIAATARRVHARFFHRDLP